MNKHFVVWQDPQTQEIYQGYFPLVNLSPLSRSLLLFLLKNAEVYVTKTELVASSWPKGKYRQGVSDDAIYQQIMRLRKALRQRAPYHRYVVNWRGSPEGGYRFFPDGQPYKQKLVCRAVASHNGLLAVQDVV